MKFVVNEGQRIARLEGKPGGKAERVILVGGDEVEGPDWWAREFIGRMTPLDDQGNPIDLRALEQMSADLPTMRAHERVGLLREMIDRNPSIADALQSELAKAEDDAETARLDFEAKRDAAALDTAQQISGEGESGEDTDTTATAPASGGQRNPSRAAAKGEPQVREIFSPAQRRDPQVRENSGPDVGTGRVVNS